MPANSRWDLIQRLKGYYVVSFINEGSLRVALKHTCISAPLCMGSCCLEHFFFRHVVYFNSVGHKAKIRMFRCALY